MDRVDRRTFIKRGALAGGALTAGGLGLADLLSSGHSHPTQAQRRHELPARAVAERDGPPNILVVIVDQLRAPRWFPPTSQLDALLSNVARLRSQSVSFARHYTVANDCTPARAGFITGLYPHQTGCLITGRSTLDPGFPTYGTMLREHGYQAVWYGKWHLTRGDNHWYRKRPGQSLERYGFDGGTYPAPDGAPGQGLRVDPHIAGQFEDWLAQQGGQEPWCATVSFVNPHDIAWWYRITDRQAGERSAPSVFKQLPANFQTPEQLIAANKPSLQLSFLETAARGFGEVPYTGPEAHKAWTAFLDLYLLLQRAVDEQVGRVLAALRSRPELAEITVHAQEHELYDYSTQHGRLELQNLTGLSPLEDRLRHTLEHDVIPHEVRQPLPARLAQVQRRGFANYFSILPQQSATASQRHAQRASISRGG